MVLCCDRQVVMSWVGLSAFNFTATIEGCLTSLSTCALLPGISQQLYSLEPRSLTAYRCIVVQRKRERAEQIKHLSQDIRERNQATAESSPGRHGQSARPNAPESSPASTRQRMREYARNVQKAALHNRTPSPRRLR